MRAAKKSAMLSRCAISLRRFSDLRLTIKAPTPVVTPTSHCKTANLLFLCGKERCRTRESAAVVRLWPLRNPTYSICVRNPAISDSIRVSTSLIFNSCCEASSRIRLTQEGKELSLPGLLKRECAPSRTHPFPNSSPAVPQPSSA